VIDQAIVASRSKRGWQKSDKANLERVEQADDIADLYENIYSKYSTTGKMITGIFKEADAREAALESLALSEGIVKKLRENQFDAFLDPDTGDIMMRQPDGTIHEVDGHWFNSLANAKGETAGAIAGGFTGARVGARAGAAIGTSIMPGPGTAIGTAAGTVIG